MSCYAFQYHFCIYELLPYSWVGAGNLIPCILTGHIIISSISIAIHDLLNIPKGMSLCNIKIPASTSYSWMITLWKFIVCFMENRISELAFPATGLLLNWLILHQTIDFVQWIGFAIIWMAVLHLSRFTR